MKLEGEQTDRHEWLRGHFPGGPGVIGAGLRLSARRSCSAGCFFGGFRGAHLRYVEAFENVADFHIVEVGHARAAFESCPHFAGVILEALQRAELRRVNDRAVADHPNLRVALEDAVQDVAARHRARAFDRSEEHTSELQSRSDLVCRLLLEKKKKNQKKQHQQNKKKQNK